MNRYYFLTFAAGLLSCFTVGVSHPGKSRRALRSDEAWVICSRFTQLPSKAFPGNTTSVCFRNLSSIASDDLKIFPQLRQLSLISNQLRTLPADLLKGLSKLHILDLTGNNLTSLSSRVFHHSPLVELILSGNLLSEVDPDCLPVNSSLQRLDLSSNRFTQLPVAFLQRLSNLESLDFSNNQLEELTPGALTSLSKLEALYLENNRLKFIDPLSFSGNPNLEQIFLSGNRLASLPTKLFLKQDKLVFLDLRNNYLQSLTPGTLDGLVVHTVLSGNPWHCNSSLAYLWHWLHMNEKRLFHYDKITCQTPEHMKGRNIMDIAAIELGIKE